MWARGKLSGETIALIPLYVFGVVILVTALVFGITCLVTEHHGGAHRAWEVLIGVRTPVGQAIGLELALSVLGYAFVPVVVGLFATDAVLRFTRKHTVPTADVLANIGEGAKRSAKAAKESAEQAQKAAEQAKAAGQTQTAAPQQTALPPRPPIQPSAS